MMGELPPAQNSLFYDFCLEKHVPQDHFLRQVDTFLDFSAIRNHLQPFYSHTGRPSIDPELMIRMLIIGYCYGIRSERRLCEEVNLNLAYRWFCQLGLEKTIPDHSTFSKNRHGRFRASSLFREVFNSVLNRCMEEGLVKAEGFAADASFIRADVSRQCMEHSPVDWTSDKTESRAVKEYLDFLDKDPNLIRPQKSVSLTDPMCQWSGAKGPANFFYSTNYMIDVDNNIIVDVEGSPSTHAMEVSATKTMIERTEKTHGLKPKKFIADTAYGSGYNLAYLVGEKNIEPHIPLWEKGERKDGTFSRSDFEWNDEADEYTCPAGKQLKRFRRNYKNPRTGITKAGEIKYRASVKDCRNCPLKEKCCPNTEYRKVTRSVHEKFRDEARSITSSNVYLNRSRHERKKVEMLFAHMKRNLNFNRLRLRGLNSANDEFIMVAIAQNLKRLVKICGYSPPNTGLVCL